MNSALLKRAFWLGLLLVVVTYVVVFLAAFTLASSTSFLGAEVVVVETDSQPLTAEFAVNPMLALLTWFALSAVVYGILSRISASRRRSE